MPLLRHPLLHDGGHGITLEHTVPLIRPPFISPGYRLQVLIPRETLTHLRGRSYRPDLVKDRWALRRKLDSVGRLETSGLLSLQLHETIISWKMPQNQGGTFLLI